MASTQKPPSKIADFYVVPIALPPTPSLQISATHYLYLKPHIPITPTPESEKSLFLVNIPIDTTETHLKHLFSTQIDLSVGRVLKIQFEDSNHEKTSVGLAPTPITANNTKKTKKRKRAAADDTTTRENLDFPPLWDRPIHRSGSTATVVFVDKASMDVAFKAIRAAVKAGKTITWGAGIEDKIPPLGSQRYDTHHALSYPPPSTLLSSVNAYMTAYNAQQEAAARALARKRQQPDEDGFVTVTRAGRNAAARMEDAQERLEKQREREKRRADDYGDFYRFQGREKRKARAAELVRKFEEDRERVRRMRGERGRFQPE